MCFNGEDKMCIVPETFSEMWPILEYDTVSYINGEVFTVKINVSYVYNRSIDRAVKAKNDKITKMQLQLQKFTTRTYDIRRTENKRFCR